MSLLKSAPWLGGCCGWILLAATPAQAKVVLPGEVFEMTEDLVLSGSEDLRAGEEGQARCIIHGHGHTISSADGWTGSLAIKGCDVDELGASSAPAINVSSAADGAYTVSDSQFSASGQLIFRLGGDRGMSFLRNLIAEDSVVSAVTLLESSAPSVFITGASTPQKLFQGNVVLHSRAQFQATNHWLVGGTNTGDGNVLVGTRVGFDFNGVDDFKVIGNYSHTTIPELGWNQVKNLTGAGSNVVIQHNVLWGFNWLLEVSVTGEVSYNLLIDDVERGWALLRDKAGTQVHHNLMIATKDSQFDPEGAFVVDLSDDQSSTELTQVFNNTFEGGGVCVPALHSLVQIKGARLASLRSNAFVDVRVRAGLGGLIRGGALDYTDYNLFYFPDSPEKNIYATTVAGRAPGQPGFGSHDATVARTGGSQQEVALFGGKVPRAFPYQDSAIVAGQTTVCQILAFYRRAFTPVANAGMLQAGDPADGASNSIGAIGVGAADAMDLFGRAPFCDAGDLGSPSTDPAIYTCTPVPVGGAGTTIDPNAPHGFMCVCDAGAGLQSPAPLGAVLALAGVALAARPRRRRR